MRLRSHFRSSIPGLIKEINSKLKDIVILKLERKDDYCVWNVLSPDFWLILSIPLMKQLELWQDVLTQWDLC